MTQKRLTHLMILHDHKSITTNIDLKAIDIELFQEHQKENQHLEILFLNTNLNIFFTYSITFFLYK
jgi:hypothetical protein